MKSDVLTLAVIAVVVGMLVTGLSQLDVFSFDAEAPSELQRGFQQVSDTYK